MKCRNCGSPANIEMVDLGMSPLCESFLTAGQLDAMEPFYPLAVHVCDQCWLVQLDEYVSPEDIFTEYAYFSSYSTSWLEHCKRYAAEMIERLALDHDSLVMELASNDGYLLRWFVDRGIPVLGVEPAVNVAADAEKVGVDTLVEFFGVELGARLRDEGIKADLIAANNVLAQCPDLHDFVGGIPAVLAPGGVVTVEVPHVMQLIDQHQFDTIYHEHFSYFSAGTAQDIFGRHDLELFDVEALPTHGGSLRLFFHHADDSTHQVRPSVGEIIERERRFGLFEAGVYEAFGRSVEETKRSLLAFLIEAKRSGATIAGYGAAGKGNTLLNYCGIRTDFLDFISDRNPYKHGRFTPGTHIPIEPPSAIDERRPDYVLILPWNLAPEIMSQLDHIGEWGGKFVVPIPETTIHEGGNR